MTNGSRIRLWWRTHHYLAFIQSGLLFSWQETETNKDFRRLFVLFSLYIGMIQVAQFYYQSQSLYYKRAFPAVRDFDGDSPQRVLLRRVLSFFSNMYTPRDC
jgi:hypothetical protein